MIQTIQELTAGDTTTSTTGVSTVQASQWLKEILEAAKKKMYFEQFAYQTITPQGVKDVRVPRATTNVSFTTTTSELSRTYTQIDNVDTVTFTPAVQKLGAKISKEVVDTSQIDYIRFAREQMAYDAALKIDNAFATAIAAAGSPAATLYGGDATNTTTLEAGDILTTDLIAKAQRYLKANGWVSEPDRAFVLFISAVCEEALLKDSQFVNASEYGSNEVVMNGEIGRYLGLRVISTEQCPSASTWGGGSLAGHTCFLLKAKVAYGIAYRDRPTMDFEYRKDEAAYRIYLDMSYECKTLQEGALVLIKVLDA